MRVCFAIVIRHHGDVLITPVGGESHLAKREPHQRNVFLGKFYAQPPELLAGNIVFSDMIEFFHFHFRRETMAVPSLREHHIKTFHTFIAGKKVDIAPV